LFKNILLGSENVFEVRSFGVIFHPIGIMEDERERSTVITVFIVLGVTVRCRSPLRTGSWNLCYLGKFDKPRKRS
ncbi:MAG: hypothetical protein WA125_07845, partial [Desulfosporosinus sp.]